MNYSTDLAGAEETARTIEGLGRRAAIFKANVSKEDEVQAMFQHMFDTFGKVDICVPNAAIQLNAKVDDMTLHSVARGHQC